MADSRTSGVELSEENRTDRAIARVPTAITAFVGRTLKGPVNTAVAVDSFAEFQQLFGGLWQPSTLSYAVEHFFENGGRHALIVRLVNGARPPTLTLPAGGHAALRLIGLNPGSREYLRASVDYDGVGEQELDRFNLVVQRVRAAGSELIEDQEIFRRVSILPSSGRFITDVLLESRLVRVTGSVPAQRPERSHSPQGGASVGYAVSNTDGDDGGPLTDYDVIGSATNHTGLFALKGTSFNMLCIPPLTRDHDLGLSTLLVGARFCRESQAILLVDPPSAWLSAKTALDALRGWPFRSDSAVMYFPRVQAFDRLRGRIETFGSCGAAAGMIARADETWPVWAAAEGDEAILRPGLRPAVAVSDEDRVRLSQVGVNTLLSVRSNMRPSLSPRTLAAGVSGASDWKYLSARRLALFIAASIEQGTRWVTLEHNSPATWEHARRMVEGFLDVLAEQGAFMGSSPEESHFVISDERVNRPDTLAQGKLNLLFGFARSKPGEFDAWLVTHQPGNSRVRPVSVNRLVTARQRVEWEIETTILRGYCVRPTSGYQLPSGVPDSAAVVRDPDTPKPPPPGVRIVNSSPAPTSK